MLGAQSLCQGAVVVINCATAMGCGASCSDGAPVTPSDDTVPVRGFSKTKTSSWHAVVPHDIPENVNLAPDRRDHIRHVGKLNRFLRKIQLDPEELFEKVGRRDTDAEVPWQLRLTAADALRPMGGATAVDRSFCEPLEHDGENQTAGMSR
eukprot:Skav221157  [mRNA]  locus=scaffold85:43907:48149:- [translate_table: standard]